MIYKNLSIVLNQKVLKQINKRKAEKLFKKGIEIYVNPCKLRLFSNWTSPFPIENQETRTFEEFINSIEYYNCNSETGNYLHYFVEESNL